MPEMVFKQYKD